MRLLIAGSDAKMNEALARWTLGKIGVQRILQEKMYYTIGVINDNNQLVAAVLYHNYERLGENGSGKIELSMAAVHPGWCRRGIMAGLLYYPLIQLNCHIIISTVKMKNKRVRKLAEGVGFKYVGKVNHWPYAEDSIIYSLRIEDAKRWILPREDRKAA